MQNIKKVAVIIVDDDPLARRGLASLIREDSSLVLMAEAGSGNEGLEKIVSLKPDIAIIDIRLGDDGINGLKLTKLIKIKSPETTIIILSNYLEESYFSEAMELGVTGYFLKDEIHDLPTAIKKYDSGETFLS